MRFFNFFACICLIFSTSVFSFADETLPSSTDLGRFEQQLQPPPEPKSEPRLSVPVPAKQMPPEKADEIQFELSGITLQGNTVYSAAELLVYWQDLLGKKVTLTQVYAVADAITAHYRNAGYILTQAIIPPQQINNGMVLIKVIEGHAQDVIIEGDVKGRQGLFNAWVKKIKASKPLNNAVLERYTLIANDVSGLTVKSIIRPSKTTSGASDVVFVIEHKPFDADISYDNRGTRAMGPRQITANLGANSLVNLLERTNLTILTTDDFQELHYYALQHSQLLNSEGLTLNFSGNISYSDLGDYLDDYDVEGRNKSFNVELAYPIIRSRNKNLSCKAALTVRNSRTDTMDELQSEDRLRIVKFGIDYDYTDRWQGVNMVNLMYYGGLDIFGSRETGSDHLTRADGHSQFAKVTLDLYRRQILPYNFSLLLAGTAQWADVSLLSSEEFGYGGTQYGRAYDFSSITGDKGLAGKLELQYSRGFGSAPENYYQLYAFYDVGRTFQNSQLKDENDTGQSIGCGVRFRWTQYLSGSVEIAQPLTAHISENNRRDDYARVFFNVTAKY